MPTKEMGCERDFIEDNSVYIVDMYNRWIYPGDTFARCKEQTIPCN